MGTKVKHNHKIARYGLNETSFSGLNLLAFDTTSQGDKKKKDELASYLEEHKQRIRRRNKSISRRKYKPR